VPHVLRRHHWWGKGPRQARVRENGEEFRTNGEEKKRKEKKKMKGKDGTESEEKGRGEKATAMDPRMPARSNGSTENVRMKKRLPKQ
jgi:hypothetical protein